VNLAGYHGVMSETAIKTIPRQNISRIEMRHHKRLVEYRESLREMKAILNRVYGKDQRS
jgi:hypothetical protein